MRAARVKVEEDKEDGANYVGTNSALLCLYERGCFFRCGSSSHIVLRKASKLKYGLEFIPFSRFDVFHRCLLRMVAERIKTCSEEFLLHSAKNAVIREARKQ